MKINNINKQMINTNIYNKTKDIKNTTTEKSNGSVNIEISNSAKELVQKINQSNDTKYSERVEKIRQSIMEGSYKVNTEDIADRIMKAMESQKGSDI